MHTARRRRDARLPLTKALVVGHGIIGRSVAEGMKGAGLAVIVSARRPNDGVIPLTLGPQSESSLARLVETESVDVVVLAHGPSDPEWCAQHEEEAQSIHVGAARAAARTGLRVILVSSDSVFPGKGEYYEEGSQTGPAHAYGRIKLEAEKEISRVSTGCIVRISAVYEKPRYGARRGFSGECFAALKSGKAFKAPIDQFFTPVYMADVVRILNAVVREEVAGLIHLGGPARISRAEFARMVAKTLKVPESLVKEVPGASTVWASRPRNSCLRSTDFARRFGWSYTPTSLVEGLEAALVR